VNHQRGRLEAHVRVLVPGDAAWVVETDRAAATALARDHGWEPASLEAEIAEGAWSSDSAFGWAVIVEGQPSGFALVTGMDTGDARMSIRIAPGHRGRGVAREVLRQLADHHFSAHPELNRLTGRAHEHNVPMQRVFNAAGFRMEARYRDSFKQADDGYAAEWGYALTRADWEAGRHRSDQAGYDLHGLCFEVEEVIAGAPDQGTSVRFLQEGRRVIARYDADRMGEGELAGILLGDLLQYRFVHLAEHKGRATEVAGRGRARLQRRKDGRLELVDEWSEDSGTHGRRVLVERLADA
jgi:RimJ/RimL family protein N-acetyltransferase